jgi:rhamnosyltransferase
MTRPFVSIVLPTRDGMATLPTVLDSIARQQVDFPFETIAVDSSSTDGTAEFLRTRVERLVEIPAETFDHGLTRNLGIREANGDLIVLLVQDAVPASDLWLAALTAPLASDERLAGTYARQLPRPDASPIARAYLSRWAGSSEVARTVAVATPAAFDALDPQEKLERCTFDNVCSCIRRSVWSEHPFRSTPIGEDIEWARDVLLAGYRLAYAPQAEVIHSHDRPVRYEFVRTCLLHRRLYELFGLRAIPSAPLLARSVVSSLVLHGRLQLARNRTEGAGLSAALRAIALGFAWPLGQYFGALSGARGWKVWTQ